MDDEPAGFTPTPLLDTISSPEDLRDLSFEQCEELSGELRRFVVEAVKLTGGHLGSNLGAVELTLAIHRVFSSPEDVVLFDTGHQAYVHKLVTGRKEGFYELRQEGGLSGYPKRAESPHDLIENSHASAALSWAHGIATGIQAKGQEHRHVVCVVGDGALTGGMAYEALNNLGHSQARVLVVLNDNGRSYAPTISKLSESLTQLRLDPRFARLKRAAKEAVGDLPLMGTVAEHSYRGLTSALREVVEPHVFFEALGVRYTGPIDGHDQEGLEQALRRASRWPGPIVLHVLTKKGKGYGPAEKDEEACLHDLKVSSPQSTSDEGALRPRGEVRGVLYKDVFSSSLLGLAGKDERIVALTAAMPGPTGLLPFKAAFPDRFFDVGIAEQHAMTAAAGMAHEGLRPVVCVYSTFLQRCLDQWNLDVGLHHEPVTVIAISAGITGDDGPSHNGIYDLHSALSIPGVAVYVPSDENELEVQLADAIRNAPSVLRYPKTPSKGPLGPPGEGGSHRVLLEGDKDVVLCGIGKLARACLDARLVIEEKTSKTPVVIDPRVIRPASEDLIELLSRARLVLSAEDGLLLGGAGQYISRLVTEHALARKTPPPAFVCLGVEAEHLSHAKPDDILSSIGLDGEGIAASLVEAARAYRIDGYGEEPATQAVASNGKAAHSNGKGPHLNGRAPTAEPASSAAAATSIGARRR